MTELVGTLAMLAVTEISGVLVEGRSTFLGMGFKRELPPTPWDAKPRNEEFSDFQGDEAD